jgi:hypothetical protein
LGRSLSDRLDLFRIAASAAVERSFFTFERFSEPKIAASPRSNTEAVTSVFWFGARVSERGSTTILLTAAAQEMQSRFRKCSVAPYLRRRFFRL